MSALLQWPSRRGQRPRLIGASALVLFSALGCGGLACPEGTHDVDGVCRKGESSTVREPDEGPDAGVATDERCDGVDNDGDEQVDEVWPLLGEPCGESRGECVPGTWVCADDQQGVVCEGGVAPTAEVCDGLDNDCNGVEDDGPAEVCDGQDNDCDGFIDEGVLAFEQERFDDHATITAVAGGFALTRLLGEQVRMETYDTRGQRTGHHDDVATPNELSAFLESDASGERVVVALGQHRFHVLEASVDESLVPIFVDSEELHDDWDQGIDWGIYEPPRHPRVVASPWRFLGHRDLITFALSPFSSGTLHALSQPPIETGGLIPYQTYFDSDGAFVVWEAGDNVRAGWLLDDGSFLQEIDVARGSNPAVAVGVGGPGVVFLQDGRVRLSELGGATLQCQPGGLCNALVDAAPIEASPTRAMGLGYDGSRDAWVVVASEQLLVVGRGEAGPVVLQSRQSSVSDEAPRRIDVAVAGGTAAIIQADEDGSSVLSFMGCF